MKQLERVQKLVTKWIIGSSKGYPIRTEIFAIGSGTRRKTVRTDWRYQGQTTETIADKEEGESKT